MPPTVCTLATLDSPGAPFHWSIASASARRTRTSSNGFLPWFGVIRFSQFQSEVCTAILSPSCLTNWSRAEGGMPRNSIAARSARIASIRTASFGAKIATKPSR